MDFEIKGGDIVSERLAWHEGQEAHFRQLAEANMRQAEEHRAMAAAFRVVLEDLDEAVRRFFGRSPKPTEVSLEDRGSNAGTTAEDAAPTATTTRVTSKPFIDWAREAVISQDNTFDLVSVRNKLEEIAPGLLSGTTDRNALSKALSRLAETGEIFILRKGQGKRPALYSKKNPALATVSLARFATLEADDDRPEEEVNDISGQVSEPGPTTG